MIEGDESGVGLAGSGGTRWSGLRLPSAGRLTVVLVLLGVLARLVRYGLNFPLWGDEAFVAVNFLLRDFAGLFKPLVYGQIAPLGFMWTELAVTRAAGFSEAAMRFVPMLSGLVSLLLFWRFMRRNFGAAITLVAVGILAASYYPIRHAAEVKPYATDLLISLILTMAGWAVYQRPKSMGRWVVLIILAPIFVWCSYPSVFVSGGVGLLLVSILLRDRSPRMWVGCVVYGVVLVASFLPMYAFFAKPHVEAAAGLTEIKMWTQTFPPVTKPWMLPVWAVVIHTGNMMAYPIGGAHGASIVTLVLVIAGSVTLWRTRRALLLLLLGPPALNLIAAALHAYPYGGTARTSLYMAPAICLLAGVGLVSLIAWKLPYERRRVAIPLVGVVLGLIAVVCMARDVAEPFKKPETRESRRVVRSLSERVGADDRVVVFLATEEVEHAPYIREAKGMGAQLAFYLMRYLMHQLPADLDNFGPPVEAISEPSNGHVWLIVFQRTRKGKSIFEPALLETYLGKMQARFGTYEREAYSIKETKKDQQRIEVYRFGVAG